MVTPLFVARNVFTIFSLVIFKFDEKSKLDISRVHKLHEKHKENETKSVLHKFYSNYSLPFFVGSSKSTDCLLCKLLLISTPFFPFQICNVSLYFKIEICTTCKSNCWWKSLIMYSSQITNKNIVKNLNINLKNRFCNYIFYWKNALSWKLGLNPN